MQTCFQGRGIADLHSRCSNASELNELSWNDVAVDERQIVNNWPCCRWGHSLVVIEGGRAVVFGGESEGSTCSDVQAGALFLPLLLPGPRLKAALGQVLDTNTWQWSAMQCTGEKPERRFGHSCVYHNGNVIIFGGSKGAGYYEDLCCCACHAQSIFLLEGAALHPQTPAGRQERIHHAAPPEPRRIPCFFHPHRALRRASTPPSPCARAPFCDASASCARRVPPPLPARPPPASAVVITAVRCWFLTPVVEHYRHAR